MENLHEIRMTRMDNVDKGCKECYQFLLRYHHRYNEHGETYYTILGKT